ncbi:aluminum-activated malate transporter 14-like protein [Corchorus olitorius]|uniref:Aluminum-activated malate transporter 14-like protein n=1 Tax=Corchorus olitorius TaxID=93759 RepID=A0A1R3GPD5_9ROSI|nr:aluminum-activated malate transporter 14-like protein [Corchorus olitorius]
MPQTDIQSELPVTGNLRLQRKSVLRSVMVMRERFFGLMEKEGVRFKDLRELTDRIQRMSLSWQPRSLRGKFPPLL